MNLHIKLFESFNDASYKQWKRKNVTLRGMKEIGIDNGVHGLLGKGLYTVPLSNRSMARSYGEVYFVVNGRPKNPRKFQTLNTWEIWYQNNIKQIKPDMTSDRTDVDIAKEMLLMGYDGIEIVGREMVNFKPEEVMYFKKESDLIDYYDTKIL
jgi:hypothetical protein